MPPLFAGVFISCIENPAKVAFMIDPNDWPFPPLQVLDAGHLDLPFWDEDGETPRPAWVSRIIKSWACGLVPIVQFIETYEEHWRYFPAFSLDGVEWSWRDDDNGVWTLVHVEGMVEYLTG